MVTLFTAYCHLFFFPPQNAVSGIWDVAKIGSRKTADQAGAGWATIGSGRSSASRTGNAAGRCFATCAGSSWITVTIAPDRVDGIQDQRGPLLPAQGFVALLWHLQSGAGADILCRCIVFLFDDAISQRRNLDRGGVGTVRKKKFSGGFIPAAPLIWAQLPIFGDAQVDDENYSRDWVDYEVPFAWTL